MLNNIISGLIGALASLLLFPLLSYLGLRWFNWCRVSIVVDEDEKLTIRVQNNSLSTLRNASAYISIQFDQSDLATDRAVTVSMYMTKPSTSFMSLAWAKVIEGGNRPIMDVHQWETPDLCVMKLDGQNQRYLVIGSENGLDVRAKVRAYLNSNQEYTFRIRVTAENMFPKTKKFRYDPQKKGIVQTS